jgi:Bax protein
LARVIIVVGAIFVIIGGVMTFKYLNSAEEAHGIVTEQKELTNTNKEKDPEYSDEDEQGVYEQERNQSKVLHSPERLSSSKVAAQVETTIETSNQLQRPPFKKIKDIKARKKAFFDFLLPLIREENTKIWNKRQSLLQIRDSIVKNKQNDPSILEKLQALAVEYKLDSKQKSETIIIDQLLAKIDVIPPGLVLAQAANESAWGTSRFAREGNNYFGQWCYRKGCGLIPKSRSKGMKHEVAKFDNAKKSVVSYMRNINIHPAYTELRKLRTQKRLSNKQLDSVSLAKGLINYSERREAYVREIVEMIKFNKIDKKHPINPAFQ